MPPLHRTDTLLRQRLDQLIVSGNISQLPSALGQLSVADFRRAGKLLADDLLPSLDNETYWACFHAVVPTNPKAYLMTFLKAAVKLYRAHRLILSSDTLAPFASKATPIDKRKTLNTLLPLVATSDEVTCLLAAFSVDNAPQAAPYLVKSPTPPCLYSLFVLLKKDEPNRELIGQCIAQLVARGGTTACNMASILANYFDCPTERAQFALRIPPYMLSRLEMGEEAFYKILQA